ncbi:MAG TPA: hypothetical protein VK203_10900 [Nostocaceae cyanobacterium]|nr:hypothetical protein [Nostocaceae cyanobacterium]
MKLEKWSFLLQLLPLVGAALIFLANGGFTVGTQLANFGAELKLLRHEVVAQNSLQDYRLGRLEKILIKSEGSLAATK